MHEIFWQIVGSIAAFAAFVGLIVYRVWQERRRPSAIRPQAQGGAAEMAAPRRAR